MCHDADDADDDDEDDVDVDDDDELCLTDCGNFFTFITLSEISTKLYNNS
jgi:hypothetical protein